MEKVIFCPSCTACIAVTETAQVRISDLMADPCAFCGKEGLQTMGEDDAPVRPLRSLNSSEYFQGQMGFGMPEEQVCPLEKVQTLLRETPLRRVEGFTIPGTSRTHLEYLELWDGTRIYLGSGAGGALVYRISKVEKSNG